MWPTSAAQLLGLDAPVIQAPMAGGPSTVELAASVSNAGGLGSLAGGYLSPERLRDEIRRLRAATDRPFAVNLFVPASPTITDEALEAALAVVTPYRQELGLPDRPAVSAWAEDFDEQFAVVVEERVPVFSFAFGPLGAERIEQVRSSGAVTIGTVTNVAEARVLAVEGVDVVCAQGAEAGGHHGTWLVPARDSLVGTLALVPLVCNAVEVPVIAAGGVMDGRGLAAVLCLGAGAAQMGTAFLLAEEAATAAPHRDAVRGAAETDIDTTAELTGRLARGVRNRLMVELRGLDVPAYPIMHALTSELRRTAAATGDKELMSSWCGQGAPSARPGAAADLVREVTATAAALLRSPDGS